MGVGSIPTLKTSGLVKVSGTEVWRNPEIACKYKMQDLRVVVVFICNYVHYISQEKSQKFGWKL